MGQCLVSSLAFLPRQAEDSKGAVRNYQEGRVANSEII